MSKHTPGPWAAGTDSGHHAVLLPDGRIGAYCGVVGADDDAESRANALVFAAALDLLQALQDLFSAELEKCMAYDGHDDQMQAVDRARAAIAKATGEGA